MAGAVFLVLRDGQIISTEETKADGTITVSNVSEGYYEFIETSAPTGFDCDRTPVGVHVNAEDLQGEQTITVTKVNYHKRSLTIAKRDAETGAPVANTSFHIQGVNVSYENDVVTGADGKVTLPDMVSGCYEITETNVPAPYLLDVNNRRTVWIDASEGQDVVVDFVNSTRPGLQLMKTDHGTGKPIAGVTFLIEQVGGGYSGQHITDENGLIVLEGLEPSAYTVTEVKPAPGYVTDATPRTVWLEKDRTTTLELTNVRKPDLRILKYDQQSGKPLAGVTFEVWHDGELFGEYTTDSKGEIYLSGLDLGTYLVKEVATDDDHVVNSTPQQIELTADRTETAQLVFLNSKKPGIHLIKVDSVTMKSLPNVRFEFKLVGGSYRQEFTTDINGEIDLSKLTPGTYEVRELEAPDGYLIDDAVRVVQVNPDEDASFVFTNTPKPSLRLIKTSSDGSRLGGVHFRIARIEDGSHYLDRITDADGEINISDLEPGVYSVQETATVSDHIIDVREYHVELFAGQTSTITIENQKRPNLTIRKTDKDTGDPIPGVTFTLNFADGPTITTLPTGPNGTVTVENLIPGVYTVTEQNVPEGYILDTTPQQVTLLPNRDATVQFQNYKRPALTISKVDINGHFLIGAIFEVKTKAGVKIGDFPVGADGTVTIPNIHLTEGYYVITEIQAPKGYIGGFPYAASFYGIRPLWASEIVPECVSVTKRHFPDMAHVGDITKLHGGELPPVDIITFGSPCQGLSLAGQRRGLADERSGLFMEAVRIIYEMREVTHGKYPRFTIWENVPGCTSSANGFDFKAVLSALTKGEIPMPRSGKWANAGMVRSRGVDLAWVIYDSQHFGTAQRRRRVFLVCDFGGKRAGEILFVPKSLRGYFEAGGTPRQGLAAFAESGADESGGLVEVLNDQGGGFISVEQSGVSPTLRSQTHNNLPIVAGALCMGTGQANAGIMDDRSPTLTAAHEHPFLIHPQLSGTLCASGAGLSRPAGMGSELDFCVASAGFRYKAAGTAGSVGYQEETAPTLVAGQPSGVLKAFSIGAYYSKGMLSDNPAAGIRETDTSRTLDLNGGNPCCQQGGIAVVNAVDCRNLREIKEASGTLQAKSKSGGYSLNYQNPIRIGLNVRRLTPLEAERLMGFEDHWTQYGHDGRAISDSKRYQMLGNSIAVPCVAYIMQGIRDALLREGR